MIIKKVNIIAFGALKNKIVNFNDGINVIYGENESGKSTIEAFIKVWLYGFSNSRVKDLRANERVRYTPPSGENMRGELTLEFKGKEYIIIKSFGKTKKDDDSKIIEALTGEVVEHIPADEAGKYFLNINRSTFTKTLFIGQLDVGVKKDKEEEILDKISAMLGVGEGDVPIDKAFTKLETYRKSLNNVRKNGLLDNLKTKHSNLIEERYEGYTLSNNNIENEERLLFLKEEKNNLIEEISNLEIYKKYLKKVKLQKEYEEITEYLQKREELKRKDKFIQSALTYNNEVITTDFLNDIKEEHTLYLSLLDIKNEDTNKLNEKKEKLVELKEPIKNCEYIGSLGDDLSQKLMQLKIEQETLREKVTLKNKIDLEVEKIKNSEFEIRNNIGNALKLEGIRDDVAQVLEKYEELLKELKYIFEMDKSNKFNNNNIKLVSLITSILSIVGAILIKSNGVKILFVILAIIMMVVLFNSDKVKGLGKSSRIKILKNEINRLEKKIDLYNEKIGVSDCGQLVKNLRLYDEYILTKEKINVKLDEKVEQIQLLSLDKAMEQFKANEEKIEDYRKVSGVESLEQLMQEVSNYEHVRKSFSTLEIDISNSEIALKRVEEQLDLKEDRIRSKLSAIGLQDVDILEVGVKLFELKEKLMQHQEISRNLQAIEETYAVLSKGKDIEAIKNELKDIINLGFKYSYETEEEIDEAIKEKSNKLIVSEKEIKDVENSISNRFKGKRNLPDIEEEIEKVKSEIEKNEKNLIASNLAIDTLKEAYDEIRQSFGPILNNRVINAFSDFTEGKYSDAMVSDKFEIKLIKDGETLSADILSNGANDQLYLALRLAFIEMIFKHKDITIYLDDAFVQYDDGRLKNILKYLINEKFAQCLIFTCQKREDTILKELKETHNLINL